MDTLTGILSKQTSVLIIEYEEIVTRADKQIGNVKERISNTQQRL